VRSPCRTVQSNVRRCAEGGQALEGTDDGGNRSRAHAVRLCPPGPKKIYFNFNSQQLIDC